MVVHCSLKLKSNNFFYSQLSLKKYFFLSIFFTFFFPPFHSFSILKKKKKKKTHLSLSIKRKNTKTLNWNKKLSLKLLSFTTIKNFFLITFQNSLPAQNPHQKNIEVLMEGNAVELTECRE